MLEEKEKIREKENHRVFKQLLSTFMEDENNTKSENEEIAKNIKIVPKFFYDSFKKQLRVEFKIGEKQLYKLKNLPDFYEKMLNNEVYQYGAKLNFVHSIESFEKESQEILSFLLKYAEIIKYSNEMNYTYYRSNFIQDNILLSNSGLDEIFRILENKNVLFQVNSVEKNIYFTDEVPNIYFNITELDENKFKLRCNIDVFEYDILQGKDFIYLLFSDTLYRCEKSFKDTIIRILDVLRKNYTNEIIMDEKEITNFFAMVAPKIEEKVVTDELPQYIKEKYIPQKLGVKIYLDYDPNNNIIADIKFCYGKNEFNPLINQNISFARNMIKENEALNQFINTGFMLDKNNARLILVNEDKIYQFLSEDIEEYMKKYEVLATETFKKKEVHSPQMKTIGVRVENNLLQIDLSQIGIELSDLSEIMERYKLKKAFYRLKDGSFINLKQNETLTFLDNLNLDIESGYTNLKDGVITLQSYRSLYLEKCLKNLSNVEIKKDESYKTMIDSLQTNQKNVEIPIPKNLNADLRTYQKIGYQWLKTLDRYEFGGILADDMGLGKTIQVLAVILDYVNKEGKMPSLVVCPSSLTLNWLGEANKFAPSLKVCVISGNALERAKKIDKIPQYDLVITSYDSLKRDIDVYEEKAFNFRYMIADEAQYVKNNNTQNAKAIKKILTKTRFALTGTPIENSLSELWSIFDFIMPGYLFKYRKFKETFETPIVKEESEACLERLKKMIEPFVLRRIKKEVLTELPDKTISVLYNEMQEEQQKVYLAYLAKARKEINDEIKANGFESSQIKILALLMRLRQICCHPKLFLQNYEGESSKLTQCIELIKNTVESGHKILLFSGYTSMFEMIEKELKNNKISYLKLTGQTKVSDRIDLVDKFNEDESIKVFLISLKAGGTGLNLTGADVVIHYDPWWNLSAENQATDRTYRIGQKNNVQVYKLITKNSIEEKIYELQQKKAKLADNMLSTQNTFINQLSKEDIMKLFG